MSWNWYKRDARAYFFATRTLSLEDRGAFNDILELQYMHGGKLVDDDKFFKSALGISGQKWGAIKRRLIDARKIVCEGGFVWNERAFEEIGKRSKVGKKQREVAEKLPRSDEEVQKKLPRSCGEVAEKSGPVSFENNDLAPDSPRVHAGEDKNRIEKDKKEEPPLPPFSAEDEMRTALSSHPPESVLLSNGKLILLNGFRQQWLERFGNNEQRLELALDQAAGYVQPNSFRPLQAQVSSQLARIAGQKIDSDARYEKSRQSARPKTTADDIEKLLARI